MSEGFFPRIKQLLYGAASVPQAQNAMAPFASTRTTSKSYKSMFYGERWFRQSELVRKCTISNAYFSSMSAGFETEVEAPDEKTDLSEYDDLKRKIDAINKRVNLDFILFTAQVKRSVYGKAGFEIVLESTDDLPAWLLPLDSLKLKPEIDTNWKLTGFDYDAKPAFYKPEDVLYFRNLGFEADYEGLSDVEPLQDVCASRHELLGENFSEIIRTIWSPYVILQVDTSGLSEEKAAEAITALLPALKSGKSIVVTESVDATIVKLTPDIEGLVGLLEQLKQAIIANYGTPRFLLGEPIENRATAYAEFEAYIQGPIGHIQRYFKRELERNWYDPLTRKILNLADDVPLPVSVKHKWNVIRISDIFEMAKAVAVLFGAGKGIIGGIPEVGYDMLNLSRKDVEELLKKHLSDPKPDDKDPKKKDEE